MKKQLLNESDIRKMMKFANIAPLTDGFVERLNETSETTALEEDDTLEEGEHEEEKNKNEDVQEEGMGAYGKDDAAVEEDEHEGEPADELSMDEPVDEPDAGGAEGEMSLSEEEAQVLIDLGERLAAAQGDEEPMDDLGLGAEDDLGLGAEDEDEEMPLEEDLDEELVNEVIARVARRLRSSE